MAWKEFWTRTRRKTFLRFKRQEEHPVRKRAIQIAAQLGKSVIDVGCASCIDYPLFKETGMSYTGIDFTPQFIVYAKRCHPNVDAQVADATSIPYPRHSFDVAYCKDLLEHQPPEQWKTILDEMWRVARNAVVITFFISPDENPVRYNLKELDGGVYWDNKYNVGEINKHLRGRDGFKSLEIIENVGACPEGDYVIYVATK